jgi:hypothetical protein
MNFIPTAIFFRNAELAISVFRKAVATNAALYKSPRVNMLQTKKKINIFSLGLVFA